MTRSLYLSATVVVFQAQRGYAQSSTVYSRYSCEVTFSKQSMQAGKREHSHRRHTGSILLRVKLVPNDMGVSIHGGNVPEHPIIRDQCSQCTRIAVGYSTLSRYGRKSDRGTMLQGNISDHAKR